MTDDNDTIIPVPPAPRRPGRPAKVHLYPREVPARAAPEPKAERKPSGDELFDGMTPAVCASGCSEKGCVITGDICGHPYKGGLQAIHYMKKEVMERFERAKDFLKHQAIDKKRKGA